jgi:hypothetical protein
MGSSEQGYGPVAGFCDRVIIFEYNKKRRISWPAEQVFLFCLMSYMK